MLSFSGRGKYQDDLFQIDKNMFETFQLKTLISVVSNNNIYFPMSYDMIENVHFMFTCAGALFARRNLSFFLGIEYVF